MKIFSIPRTWLADISGEAGEQNPAKWMVDPLSHPALAAMSQRELGDLPFNRGWRKAECAEGSCR